MKRLLLTTTLLFSILSFSQKEELKALKKIYDKETHSTKDLETYKTTLANLESIVSEESDKVYANFYKGMLPLLELGALGPKATPADQMKIFDPSSLMNFSKAVTETIAYEEKSGKKVYTKDIEETLSWFKPMLSQAAFQLNDASRFKEASSVFYIIYNLDKKDGSNLENAALLALQSEDYQLAEKLYEEYKTSDYLNKGVVYFATDKASGQEQQMPNKETRTKMISLGTHERPREEKMITKKPEVYKMHALITAQVGDFEKAKKSFAEARELLSKDEELLNGENQLYFNYGYKLLEDDQSIVDELNKNLNNKAKYDELMAKRKNIFKNALPYFEKAFEIKPSDENTRVILKMTYEILEMKDKAAKI